MAMARAPRLAQRALDAQQAAVERGLPQPPLVVRRLVAEPEPQVAQVALQRGVERLDPRQFGSRAFLARRLQQGGGFALLHEADIQPAPGGGMVVGGVAWRVTGAAAVPSGFPGLLAAGLGAVVRQCRRGGFDRVATAAVRGAATFAAGLDPGNDAVLGQRPAFPRAVIVASNAGRGRRR
jgi:hypothetical protein